MKKLFLILILVVIGVMGLWVYFSKSKEIVAQIYQFTRLDPKIAAQSGEYKVFFKDILDENYQQLLEGEREVLILAAIEQWVIPGAIKSCSLKIKKPVRSIAAICNQYGVKCPADIQIHFDPNQETFFKTRNQVHSLDDLKPEDIKVLSQKTQILNYLLKKINESLRNQALKKLSQETKQNQEEYIDSYILSKEQLRAETEKSWYNLVAAIPHAKRMTEEEKKNTFEYLKTNVRSEEIDKYLQKVVLKIPIHVNIQKPKQKLSVRWEWTPYLGPEPTQNLSVIVFCDFFSASCRQLLSSFTTLSSAWPMVTFGFRPFFQDDDRFQLMIAEMSMCVWLKEPSKFWAFMKNIQLIEQNNLEPTLYTAVENAGANLSPIKQCFLNRETQKAVQYHLDSAAYYGVINTPVLFVGGEVFVGPIGDAELMMMIRRQLR